MYYTYVIRSGKNGRLYTGFTSDLRKRLREHNEDKARSTKGRGPFELIYYEACINELDAKAREKYLKSGMGKRYIKNRLRRFLSLTGSKNLMEDEA
jgi:putative endonuclease